MKEETATRWRLIEWNDSTIYNMSATDYNRRSRGATDLPYVHDTCIERMIRHCDFGPRPERQGEIGRRCDWMRSIRSLIDLHRTRLTKFLR
jgi:hypothetical protein